jgi:hypothetical protein
MKPNIFEISTKELTQDGFITWILQWADPSNKEYDNNLNACGVDFVKLLLVNQIYKINKVKTDRQWKHIDIAADINEKYLIIIEDKTFTREHSNQLNEYKEIAEKWCKENGRKLVCIFLKIGTTSKASLGKVRDKGFSVIERIELINFFSEYRNIKNNIFSDFVDRINNIEKAEIAFETKKIKDWDYSCWTGFYHYLDTQLDSIDWGDIPNPNGGFLGIWWCKKKWKKYDVYMQIEQGNLCFKIGKVDENHGEVRNKWHNILMKNAQKAGRNEIVKPSRFGKGIHMSVGIVERKDWLGSDEEVVNKEDVIERLKKYESFLGSCINESNVEIGA